MLHIEQICFLFAETFRSFSLLRHFGYWNILVIWPRGIIKTRRDSTYVQALWPNWLNVFGHLKNILSVTEKKN